MYVEAPRRTATVWIYWAYCDDDVLTLTHFPYLARGHETG